MENLQWYPVFYNGLETNVEVTKCGRVRKVCKYWYGNHLNSKIGEVDFSKLKSHPFGYNYVGIQIKGLKPKTVQVQQLVTAAFLGYKWQGFKNVVDHIDSNKQNNHLNNLRVITQRENTSKERTKKSGLPAGVYFSKRDKKYVSQIYFNKKRIYLGCFNTPEDASNAYKNKLNLITKQISKGTYLNELGIKVETVIRKNYERITE